ncbi:BamA/TamA family outer membrane protein [Calothrix sp. PCC 6303]|uniref:BamA/TamA family outer membrane protein n=1 Tax=Calothrix sp. PCC 6303 TaxID=1170562 RepID=UPI0002A03011|nr:BamA/TamA family outer membrane protein [Calothrix sp. PCC 6303]AFZ04292.1 surface antigen (D15) [Calothrix sp. PCC 6303]
MRLSPVLATMVAITAPLGSSLSVNAQTSQEQINPEVTTSVIDQPQEKVTAPVTDSGLEKTSQQIIVPTVNQADSLKTPVVVPSNWEKTANKLNQAALLKPSVSISPLNTTNKPNQSLLKKLGTVVTVTGQTPTTGTQQKPIISQTPAPVPLPEPVPENPPAIEQQPNTVPAPNSPTGQPTQPDINFGQPNQAAPENNAAEPRVLVSEVVVKPQSGQLAPELEQEVYRVIRTQAGRTTTKSQLQEDINAIFATGFFSNVQATPEDTPLGVRVSFVVAANPVLTKVQIQANPGSDIPSVLPAKEVDEIFKSQYGRILNLKELQEGIKQLTKRYQDQGYVLANIIGAPQVSENGVVNLQIAEGVVENIRVRFRNKDGQETNEKGDPIRGRTRNYIITRELELKPGKTFNRNIIQRDLQRVFGLGLFEDVNVSLDPASDPSKVDVVVNVVERNSGSIAAGAGISSSSGLFGTISYQEQNLGGRNQKLGTEFQVGTRELLFDVRFTDPWIAGDPYRTSYTVNAFRRRSISLIFDGKDDNIETFDPSRPDEDGDRPRVTRTGGGVTFTRPLSKDPFKSSEWVASAGLQYQRVSTLDSDGDVRKVGRVNKDPNKEVDLSASGEGKDDLLLVQLGASRDRRNNSLQPTKGSFLRIGVDQSVPVGLGNIFLTRVRGSYSQYFPVKFTNFTKGPQSLAFNVQAGTILGDLPPYEAFSIGGSNSVRGYEEGALGSGRSYVQASVEYRFPVFSVVSGALFFDVGSDLGTSTRPADVLNKSGTGYGYGLGVRVQSPLGPIRIDYGISDEGDSRINFGIGERF